jgi:predicted transglutaminase-like cysteine proteinase
MVTNALLTASDQVAPFASNASRLVQHAAMSYGILFGLIVAGSSAGSAHASSMITGGPASQPIGHHEFCRANPAECTIPTRDLGPQHITVTIWRDIVTVNALVNGSVRPMHDIDIYGKDEVWAYPNGVGDCEDYVLEKRRDLMRKGLALSNLLITVVRKPDGEGHAVLAVRTDKGDFILDNWTDAVRQWDQTGYVFLMRQSSDYPGRWVTIREGHDRLVSAAEIAPVATPATDFYLREDNSLVRCTQTLTSRAWTITAAALSCAELGKSATN